MSFLAHWAGSVPDAEIESQIKFQGMDKVNSLAASIADSFYGYSTGVRAHTDTVATQASGTYTLINGYGSTLIPGTTATQKRYLANLFHQEDKIALVRAGAVVPNAFGKITNIDEVNGTIDVTWILGSVTSVAGDQIVLANSVLAPGVTPDIELTDYNKDLVGLLEMMYAPSVHGISGATVPGWNPAYTDTSGGRYDGIKHRKAIQEMVSRGGASAGSVKTIMAQGVSLDVTSLYQENVRYNSPTAMEIQGNFKANGKIVDESHRVPPGMVFLIGDGALAKKELLRMPRSGPAWADGEKIPDRSGMVFSLNYPLMTVVTRRKRLSAFANLQEV
jgi:hypothetical protein